MPHSTTVGYLDTVIDDGVVATYCVAPGTYQMGATSITPETGDDIIAQVPASKVAPCKVVPGGGTVCAVAATVIIQGTSPTGIIQFTSGGTTQSNIDGVDVCCSPDTAPKTTVGRGVNLVPGFPINVAITNSRVHGNGQCGICGGQRGLTVRDSEIDHNGGGVNGYSSGIKTVHYNEWTGNYVHDNDGQGLWWDCDAPGGIATGNWLQHNSGDGLFVEISSGESLSGRTIPTGKSYGFVVSGNYVETNNWSGTWTSQHGGIHVNSSKNVTIDNNVTVNNTNTDIRINEDSRATGQHGSCSYGFQLANVVVSNNQYGPLPLQGTSEAGTTWTNNTKIL